MTQRINVSNKCGVFPDSLKRKPLAACLVAALGLVSVCKHASATTITVNSCADDNNLSLSVVELRKAVAQASSGDTIDLTGLTCSTITLQKGEIPISVASLTILGPTSHTLTIDAGSKSRIFDHAGAGTLEIWSLALANGTTSGSGGCIDSAGSLYVRDSTVSGCYASALGSAAYSRGYMKVKSSTISDNRGSGSGHPFIDTSGSLYVRTSTLSDNPGQGVEAHGHIVVRFTTMTNNGSGLNAGTYASASFSLIDGAFEGINAQSAITLLDTTIENVSGAALYGSAFTTITLTGSEIADCGAAIINVATGNTGPITLSDSIIDGNGYGIRGQGGPITLNASTIAGNSFGLSSTSATLAINYSTISRNTGKAISVLGGSVSLVNSTVANNYAPSGPFVPYGGGMFTYNAQVTIENSTIAFNSAERGGGIYIVGQGTCLTLQSSIIADNTVVSGYDPSFDDASVTCNVAGSNNFVGVLNFPLPGTLTGDPELVPLSNHGGPVETVALLANSPAVNAGNNLANLRFDERGSGFFRSANGAPDIGAYERQYVDDEIFYSGFQ